MPEVVARWITGKQVEVMTQGHAWIVDESKERGGTGLTEEQRVQLLRGADFCPVDNTLTQSVEIETTVVVDRA